MRIVLSAPYNGALYRWFRELAGYGYADGHPYYDAIYKGASASIDVALTSLIVYDEIVLPAADDHLPGYGGLKHLRLEDLGISVIEEPVARASELTHHWFDDLSHDHGVQALLRAREFSGDQAYTEINYAIADVLMSQEADVTVVSSPGRQELARQIVNLGALDAEINEANRQTLAQVGPSSTDPLAEYVDLIGLKIRRDDYDAIVHLKRDPAIARYSQSFRRRLGPHDSRQPDEFADALGEVLERQASRVTLQGVFKHGGRALNLAGLVPGIGTAAGILGLAGDEAEAALEGQRYTLWHELGGAIKAREFEMAMRTRVRAHRQRMTDELLGDLGFDISDSSTD